jgi:hypothetical protein
VKGMKQCPICHGTGKLHEDAQEYEFLTRDPRTDRCLYCDGWGYVGARKAAPGTRILKTEGQRDRGKDAGAESGAPAAAPRTDKVKVAYKVGEVMANLSFSGPADYIIELIRRMGGTE